MKEQGILSPRCVFLHVRAQRACVCVCLLCVCIFIIRPRVCVQVGLSLCASVRVVSTCGSRRNAEFKQAASTAG